MNFIDPTREITESNYLIHDLVKDPWLDSTVVLVNCQPEYSSRLTQYLNHKTAYLNRNHLLEQVEFLLPPGGGNQLWSYDTNGYVTHDYYAVNWVKKHILPDTKYLFIQNVVHSGRELNKLRLQLKGKTDARFLCTHLSREAVFEPDYHYRRFYPGQEPVYFWENKNQ